MEDEIENLEVRRLIAGLLTEAEDWHYENSGCSLNSDICQQARKYLGLPEVKHDEPVIITNDMIIRAALQIANEKMQKIKADTVSKTTSEIRFLESPYIINDKMTKEQ